MNENKLRLCYCIDEHAEKSITLEEKPRLEIDKLTTQYENSKELRKNYEEQIEKYRQANQEYINKLEKKNNRRETGDITLINNENKRIRVLYKRHVIVFNQIIENNIFYEFLVTNYPGYAKTIDELTEGKKLTDEEYYKMVRNIYAIYKEIYKNLKLPSPEKIYTKYKLEQQKNKIQEEFIGSLFDEEPSHKIKKLGGQ